MTMQQWFGRYVNRALVVMEVAAWLFFFALGLVIGARVW